MIGYLSKYLGQDVRIVLSKWLTWSFNITNCDIYMPLRFPGRVIAGVARTPHSKNLFFRGVPI